MVTAGGENRLAVGGNRERPDGVEVAAQLGDLFSSLQIPKANGPVVRAGHENVAVRYLGQGRGSFGMSPKAAERVSGFGVH